MIQINDNEGNVDAAELHPQIVRKLHKQEPHIHHVFRWNQNAMPGASRAWNVPSIANDHQHAIGVCLMQFCFVLRGACRVPSIGVHV